MVVVVLVVVVVAVDTFRDMFGRTKSWVYYFVPLLNPFFDKKSRCETVRFGFSGFKSLVVLWCKDHI